MTAIDPLKGLFSISACFWLLFTVFKIFSISRFIVKRYEQETDLLNTVFFKEHFAFTKYLPAFHSSGFYALHLTNCTWFWRYYNKKKIFRDISDPKQVTQYFSSKEIRRAQLLFVYPLIVALHCIVLCVFRLIWPEHFS